MKTIATRYGDLIPQHTDDDLRKREILPVEYFSSGALKSVPLENPTPIETPAGNLPAELVSFHENGSVSRIFPLNGKLSGYWSQEDEAALATAHTLITPVGVIDTKLISISFFDNRGLRSLTLWPEETLSIPTPQGIIDTRIGISFTQDGRIRSLEPALPTPVQTMAGAVTAYDPDAVGVNGDANSLVFGDDGEVVQAVTTLTRLTAVAQDGSIQAFTPEYRESLCSESEEEVVPMTLRFNKTEVIVQTNPDSPATCISRENHVFFAEPFLPQLAQPFSGLRCSV